MKLTVIGNKARVRSKFVETLRAHVRALEGHYLGSMPSEQGVAPNDEALLGEMRFEELLAQREF